MSRQNRCPHCLVELVPKSWHPFNIEISGPIHTDARCRDALKARLKKTQEALATLRINVQDWGTAMCRALDDATSGSETSE